jgi:DMSO/TMAO reductase YedYZ molybdopterin-dependent catalytic subunit
MGKQIVSRFLKERFDVFFVLLLLLVGCQAAQSSETAAPIATATPAATATPDTESATPTPCILSPVAVPTAPAETPGYAEIDPATGLHFTGNVQTIDLASYRLEVTGKVNHPLALSYDDLRCMPRVEARPTLVCPEVFTDTATWAGVSLQYILKLADMQPGATRVRLISADGYPASVSKIEALYGDAFLAYEWEGEPLPILHGFPLRAVFPELYGDVWVKWLAKIEVY